MTEIRDQLRLARDAYCSAKYPGDLAADVVGESGGALWARFRRVWWVTGGGGAVAAAVVIAMALLRTPEPSQRTAGPATPTKLAGWPFGTSRLAFPSIPPPALPVTGSKLHLEIAAPVGMYQDLAMQYRGLPVPASIPESLKHTTVPTIPQDLPSRGLDWLHKVWSGDKSA